VKLSYVHSDASSSWIFPGYHSFVNKLNIKSRVRSQVKSYLMSSLIQQAICCVLTPQQGCRGYGYPWINPWIYPWICPCVDIRGCTMNISIDASKSFELIGHTTSVISIHCKTFIKAGMLLTKQRKWKSQNQKTMLFHVNTEVFAYNSIRNRHEILTKSLYAYWLCSKCSPSASTQANRRRCHWSMASSTMRCSSSHHTVIRHCRSSSMSCTLVWYTRSCITDQMT